MIKNLKEGKFFFKSPVLFCQLKKKQIARSLHFKHLLFRKYIRDIQMLIKLSSFPCLYMTVTLAKLQITPKNSNSQNFTYHKSNQHTKNPDSTQIFFKKPQFRFFPQTQHNSITLKVHFSALLCAFSSKFDVIKSVSFMIPFSPIIFPN